MRRRQMTSTGSRSPCSLAITSVRFFPVSAQMFHDPAVARSIAPSGGRSGTPVPSATGAEAYPPGRFMIRRSYSAANSLALIEMNFHVGWQHFRLVGALRTKSTEETLFAARREPRSVAFQYPRRVRLLLRGLFGVRVNGDWIAGRKGLSERLVQLFVQGHRRFLRVDFRLPNVDAAFLCHIALHREPGTLFYQRPGILAPAQTAKSSPTPSARMAIFYLRAIHVYGSCEDDRRERRNSDASCLHTVLHRTHCTGFEAVINGLKVCSSFGAHGRNRP